MNINLIYKYILRLKLYKNLRHYVGIYIFSKIQCGKLRPWSDRFTFRQLHKLVEGNVVIMDKSLWIKTSNKFPNTTYIVVSKTSVKNKKGLTADYLIAEEQYKDIYYYFPELINKKIFITGNKFILKDSIRYTRYFYSFLSNNPNSTDWGYIKYDYDLIEFLSKRKTIVYSKITSNTDHSIVLNEVPIMKRLFFNRQRKKYNRLVNRKICDELLIK